MKILITTDWYAPVVNGVVTSVINLKHFLKELGHEVRVLTLSERMRSHKSDTVYYVNSMPAPVYPDARVGFIKHRYYKEIIKWEPDIIHSQCEFSTFAMALIIAHKLHIPIVHTYHTVYEDYTHYFFPSEKYGKKAVSVLTPKLLEHTDKVIVPTEKVRKLLIDYGVEKEIFTLPTGIDLDRFSKPLTEERRKELMSKHGIPEGSRIMLCLCRLAKEKNISELLEYFSRMESDNVTFLIAGGGPYYKELKKEAKKICGGKSVIFTDMIAPEEVCDYYKLGDFFVSASTSETQGLTYIEALANGLPVLCRRDLCIENVIVDNINGYRYESYEDFSVFAHKLLNDDTFRIQLSENALKSAERFSCYAFAENAAEIYKKAIEDKRKSLTLAKNAERTDLDKILVTLNDISEG